jgi:hypothetical protein
VEDETHVAFESIESPNPNIEYYDMNDFFRQWDAWSKGKMLAIQLGIYARHLDGRSAE